MATRLERSSNKIGKPVMTLIETHSERGFITYSELNDLLMEQDITSEYLDEVLRLLEERDMELIDDDQVELTKAERETRAKVLRSWRFRLKTVKTSQRISASARILKTSPICYDCGYVYLAINYSGSKIKIGATDRHIRKRSKELRVRYRLMVRYKYPSVVAFRLESELHTYFERFRRKKPTAIRKGERRNEAGEFFDLPVAEQAAFTETAARLERWVLAGEEAKLELRIMRLERFNI